MKKSGHFTDFLDCWAADMTAKKEDNYVLFLPDICNPSIQLSCIGLMNCDTEA